jgi:hypothetical protein
MYVIWQKLVRWMLVREICSTYDVCGRNHLEVSAWRRCREMIGATVQLKARESDEEEWRGREEGERMQG